MTSIFRPLLIGASVIAFAVPASAQIIDGDRLLGTAIGAGIGGAIGSNLAGGGVQDEGTAIGAVLGGMAGYAIAGSRGHSRYGGPSYGGYGQNYGHYGASRYGSGGYGHHYQGAYYGGYSGANYGAYYAPAPVYMPGPQYVHSGQYVTNVYPGPTYVYRTVTQPATVQIQPIQQAWPVTTSSCTLSGGQYTEYSGFSGQWSDGAASTGRVLCYSNNSARYDQYGTRIR